MTKIPAGQMRGQLEAIAKKLSDGYTDAEIMKDLNLKRSTFYLYKSRLFKVFGDIAKKKNDESLEFEADLLKERLIRLFRRLELAINEPQNELGDIATACDVAALISMNIFRLEAEGLKARQSRGIQLDAKKAVRYIGRLGEQQQQQNQVSDTTEKARTNDGRERSEFREGEGEKPSYSDVDQSVY